ncbi:MAG: hypothetical protein ACTHJM_10275 [Marmoricola sp.]|uniref:hypothetical protein n=1 Tax=Humibacter sp. TaxID=1940291 RepID=UPI003F81FED1
MSEIEQLTNEQAEQILAGEIATGAQTTTETPTDEPAKPTYPDWYSDQEKVHAEIQRLNRENAASRVNAKQTAADEGRTQILKDLGLIKGDEQPDPEALRQQLAAKDTTIRDLTVKSALSDALRDTGAKPLARAAILGEGILNDLDPASDTFAADVASKVSAYVAANPELKASQAAAVGGADLTGGATPARTFTRAQLADPVFYQANKTEIEAATRDGRII